ncbi:MAG: translocation/assembly module TamB, partial [Bacteroidales bacterium]|nr:translocation/assembly module TamB [Bacteroidales bacterium]
RTDYVDADLQGYYSFSGLKTAVKSAMAVLIPSAFDKPEDGLLHRVNNFSFTINFKNTDKLNTFFRTGISMAENSTVEGMVSSDTLLLVRWDAKNLNIKNFSFDNFALNASYTGNKFTGLIKSDRLGLIGQTELRNLKTSVDLEPDNFLFSVLWDNQSKPLNKGRFEARGFVSNYDNIKSNPYVIISIDSSDVYSNDRKWIINNCSIKADTSSIDINKLIIKNLNNYYLVNGRISKNPADSLNIEFNGIDLSSLNSIGSRKNSKTDASIPLNLRGILSGNIILTNIFRNLMFESQLNVSGFSLLGSEYGELNASSVWNSSKKVAEITAWNNLKGSKMIDVKGIYNPEVRKINLDIITNKLPVDALNPLLSSFASEITGLASGRLNLSGELKNLVLKGSVFAESAALKINYLQTRYRLNDSIRFDRNSIIFRNIRITDERGNFATLSGSVNHNYFKDYRPDLTIGMKETLVLNTKPKDNETFYGTAVASGVTTIRGRPGILSFDISARTERNTRFYIPLNTSMTASDYSFIKFITSDTVSEQAKVKTPIITAEQEASDIELNFDLEVTPDAEVQLIIDSKAGDVMKAHGSGNLNLRLNPKGVFEISGNYIIEDGDYLFTLGNILNKSFSVENGGRISFNGNIENAEIDIKAIYRLKASLYELIQDAQFSERIPVECQLNLTGNLFNPIVGFNIFLPNADEETRTIVRNAITSEEELSRQFLYLLVMNSFYSEPSYRSSPAANTGTSAMAVTTTEMLSNQLSNWLSQISNDFDLDFVYRPGYRDVNSQELEVALSTQILNDRVMINGNFDVRGASNSYGNPITGDFDIEYKLTEKIRFRVFNRFNNPYTGKGVPYTQGLGIFFKQDFDKLSDLFRKRPESAMKKEEETTFE